MSVSRHFLDWDAPVTRRLRDHLLPDSRQPDSAAPLRAFSFEDTLIVVPTRQAARRLSEALVQQAATRGAAILGARIITPAVLLAADPPDPKVASDSLSAAVWCQVLLALRPTEATTLFPPAGRRTDYDWALQAGEMIQDLRQALSDGAYQIGDVLARHGEQLEEQERWADLALLESRYHDRLTQLGWRDALAARISQATAGTWPDGIRRLIMAAVPDPTPLVITALQRAANTLDVEILVHAPAALADSFDAWGRPRAEPWQSRPILIPAPDRCLLLAASPATQGELVVAHLANHPDAAIGVPDAAVTPFVAAACEEAGHPTFDPADRPFPRHPLFSLISGITDLATDDSFPALSALLRHADVLAALDGGGFAPPRQPVTPRALLRQLDEAQNLLLPEHLAALEDGLERHTRHTGSESFAALRATLTALKGHLASLRGTQPLQALRTFLQAVYGGRRLDPRMADDSEFETAGQQLDLALRELEDAPPGPLPRDPAALFALLRLRLNAIRYAPTPRHGALNLEGWLELPWSDAAHLVVTGMNEGAVPDARRRDPFLPDPLLQLLGLRHDAARLARDAYLMTALIASRPAQGSVTFIAGKVSAAGDPLRPSRLLFRCPDAELPARAALLFGPADASRRSVPATISFPLNSAPPPDLRKGKLPMTRLSVTAFRSYLACPFRFYLGSALDMEPLDDSASGLDVRDFGHMIHQALQAMAGSGMWRHDDPGALRGFLAAEAGRWVHERFGAQPPLVVSLALEAARQRLGAAAERQVALAAAGWEIVQTEVKFTGQLGPITLVGRIDRIDRHRQTGQLRLIDYKSSDMADAPLKVHLAAVRADTPEWQVLKAATPRRWNDLQLPLYVWLIRQEPRPDWLTNADQQALPELGYFNLPKGVADTALTLWEDFDELQYADAVRCAREVVARITANCFWPPAPRVKHENFDPLFGSDPHAAMLPPFPAVTP